MAFYFTPPVIVERRGSHPLFGRLGVRQGVSVLKEGGFYRQLLDPSAEEVSGADIAYLGGRVYRVSDAEASDLAEAGYDEFLRAAGVYGRGAYGAGLYGR